MLQLALIGIGLEHEPIGPKSLKHDDRYRPADTSILPDEIG
jgi:hypothetical protein